MLPALSRACELTTDDGERAYTRHLQRGHVLGPPEPRQSEGRQGTRIEFEVDELRRETWTVGLTALLSVWLHDPGWAGSTRAVSTSARGRELCRRAAQALAPVPVPRLEP